MKFMYFIQGVLLDNVAKKNQIKRELKQGIPLPQELSDRIEVREEACDNCINLHGGSNSPNCCNNFKSVAFLLPVKEDKEVFMFPCLNKEQCKEQCKTCESLSNNGFKESDKSYTIEEIEKAIEQIKCNSIQSRMYTDKLKEEIINNLKSKLTNK